MDSLLPSSPSTLRRAVSLTVRAWGLTDVQELSALCTQRVSYGPWQSLRFCSSLSCKNANAPALCCVKRRRKAT